MSEPPRQPQQQGPHQLPKEEPEPPSEPPPAYVPPPSNILLARLSQLFNHNPDIRVAVASRPEPAASPPEPSADALAHLASISVARASNPNANANTNNRRVVPDPVPAPAPVPVSASGSRAPLPASVAMVPRTVIGRPGDPDPWDDDHSECEDLKSPITVRINAGLRISSNHNVVALATSPGDLCAQISKSVVAGMREASGGVGIPMIDEDGHPRPLRIEVDAGLDINGVGNVVGSEEVVVEISRLRADASARRAAAGGTTAAGTPAPQTRDTPAPQMRETPVPEARETPARAAGEAAAPRVGQPPRWSSSGGMSRDDGLNFIATTGSMPVASSIEGLDELAPGSLDRIPRVVYGSTPVAESRIPTNAAPTSVPSLPTPSRSTNPAPTTAHPSTPAEVGAVASAVTQPGTNLRRT